jgi:hypothetical protein
MNVCMAHFGLLPKQRNKIININNKYIYFALWQYFGLLHLNIKLEFGFLCEFENLKQNK